MDNVIDTKDLVPDKQADIRASNTKMVYSIICGTNVLVFVIILLIRIMIYEYDNTSLYLQSKVSPLKQSTIKVMYDKDYYKADMINDRYIMLICFVSLVMIYISMNKLIEKHVDVVVKQRDEEIELLKNNQPSVSEKNFGNLVDINLKYLKEYYELVENQANQSFIFASAVGLAGFILIFIGVIIGYGKDSDKFIALVSSTSGLITTFVSSMQFKNYSDTVKQLKEYHDSLINVQNILLSFKLVDECDKEPAKTDMMNKMIDYLIGNKLMLNSIPNPNPAPPPTTKP